MSSELQGPWPYERESPEVITLAAVAGAPPSTSPPVRIFLGSEDGQYRAERVFVFSVMRHRDPARAYEIHLMRNLAGFNRKGWRTGFTCYRFAIPDLAGRKGRAIYNDVDQIYLADPAHLFDLPLADHGYLAIDARDTSVMLIDCQKMLPWWSRAAASLGKKAPLTNAPASVPGLWGHLDGHWNARDAEYIEGRTSCLHYTSLHQQPWNPFPEQYSYHTNPLAYLWHDLEREADEAGFELFTARAPSPAFEALVASKEHPLGDAAPPLPVSAAGETRLRETAGPLLVVSLGEPAFTPPAGCQARTLDLARDRELPPEPAETVVASGLFERLPPADLGWVLDLLFAAAGSTVYLQLRAQEAEGVGSPGWWRRRVEAAAARHPAAGWQLDIATTAGGVESCGVRQVTPPAAPAVWVLTGADELEDRQAMRLAAALGWPFAEKRMVYRGSTALPNLLRGASLAGVDRTASAAIDGPPPDLLIAAGSRSVPVARHLRSRGQGRTRLVQLGRPAAPFELFDLIIASPEQRLPIRGNVLQVTAPLAGPAAAAAALPPTWSARLAALPAPSTALLVGPSLPAYRLDAAAARSLAQAASARAGDGSLLVWLDPGLPDEVALAVESGLGAARLVERVPRDEAGGAYAAFVAASRECVVHAGDPASLVEACLAGRPAVLYDLPRRGDDPPLLKPVMRLVLPLIGGKTYRGTPLQQHFPGRIYDWLTTHGIVQRPHDLEALYRTLEARGLVTRMNAAEPVAKPRPLDDLARSVARIRDLLKRQSVVA